MVKNFSITDLLLDLAQDVRTGIENCPERYKLAYSVPCWNSFPLGGCKFSAFMFAGYLNCFFENEILHEHGCRGKESHSWTVVNDYIVDLTVDQFPQEFNSKIYVGTRNSFYLSFQEDAEKHRFADLIDCNQTLEYDWYYGSSFVALKETLPFEENFHLINQNRDILPSIFSIRPYAQAKMFFEIKMKKCNQIRTSF